MRFEHANGNYSDACTPVAPLIVRFDNAADDSNKSYAVPAGEMWKLTQAFVTLVTSATVGNRQIRFSVVDPDGNQIGYISSGAVQAASTTRGYGFMQGIYRETTFIDGMIQIPIPVDLYLVAGSSIRFWDSAAVDAAADDLTVSFTVQRYKGC